MTRVWPAALSSGGARSGGAHSGGAHATLTEHAWQVITEPGMEMEESGDEEDEEVSTRPSCRGTKQWAGASACMLSGAGVFMVSMGYVTSSSSSSHTRKFDHIVPSVGDAASPVGVKELYVGWGGVVWGGADHRQPRPLPRTATSTMRPAAITSTTFSVSSATATVLVFRTNPPNPTEPPTHHP